MNDPRDSLVAMLAATKTHEMDCDVFLDLVAAYADGRPLGPRAEPFEHHRVICPECEEELDALLRALGRRP